MKRLLIRFQLVFVSGILLATFVMMMGLVMRYNSRWDLTREKLYSLSEETLRLFQKMGSTKIEVLAFYPHDDPSRQNFELFLREAQLHHPHLKYDFYDPDRVPRLAKKYNVKDFYTVAITDGKRVEKIVAPNEESFVNAILRLAQPRRFGICFVIGHNEAALESEERTGLHLFKQNLAEKNYDLNEIILVRDGVPASCQVAALAGPHRNLDGEEFGILKNAFDRGIGILFLIDPMDTGTGKPFRNFMKEFGVLLGEDVIVDKMSRLVGGDFLVPLVSQYVEGHPITENFERPTFFPVTRSVQPSTDPLKDIEVVPLALTSSGSWAETNLVLLEKGEASFEKDGDLMGPIPIAAAVEKFEGAAGEEAKTALEQAAASAGRRVKGRMVVVGDSDFITNGYLSLSGNGDFAFSLIQWLTRDDRFISIRSKAPAFKPLFMTSSQRLGMLSVTLGVLPASFLIFGSTVVFLRKRPR